MTPEELTRLRELDAAATPGPWEIDPLSDDETTAIQSVRGIHLCLIQHEKDAPWVELEGPNPTEEANANLIVALRNALPSLLTHIDDQAREIERLRACITYRGEG